MSIRKNIVIAAYAAAFIAALAVLVPAFAGEASRLPQVVVRYDDLNISRRAGAEVLVGRLQHASKQVCGEEPFLANLRGQALYQTCVRSSMARAVTDVGEPAVMDAYQQRSGRPFHLAGN